MAEMDQSLSTVAHQITTHEIICSMRYNQINDKMATLNDKFDMKLQALKEDIAEVKTALYWGVGAIITGFGGVILMRVF